MEPQQETVWEQDGDKTRTQSRPQSSGARGVLGQDPDTEPATEPSHSVHGRGGQRGAQEEDKTWTQSSGARPRQGQEEDKTRTQPGHRAQPQSSGARPVSVASSFSLR